MDMSPLQRNITNYLSLCFLSQLTLRCLPHFCQEEWVSTVGIFKEETKFEKIPLALGGSIPPMGAQETAQDFLLLSSNNKRALTSINEVYKLEYSISIMLIIVNV